MGLDFNFSGSTDLVGPFPQDWYWWGKLQTSSPIETRLLDGLIHRPITNSFSGILGYENDPDTSLFRPTLRPFPIDARVLAQTWSFSIELTRPTGVVEDQTSVPVTLDMQTGATAWLAARQTAATGGYTEQDRAVALETRNAAIAALPLTTGLGELADVALSALAGCPPENLLVPSSPTLIYGSGTLERPSGTTGVYAYGFTTRLEVVPPGLSVIDGRALEYPERLAQFLLIRVDSAGNEYVSDRWALHQDQERVCWGVPFPKRVEYSVLPGVSMRFYWLLFPIGQ